MGIFPTVSVRSTTPRLAEALAHRGCVVTAAESADVVIDVAERRRAPVTGRP